MAAASRSSTSAAAMMTTIRRAQMAKQSLRKLLPSLSTTHLQKAAATPKVNSAVFAADS
jgi:hypothetical protein